MVVVVPEGTLAAAATSAIVVLLAIVGERGAVEAADSVVVVEATAGDG